MNEARKTCPQCGHAVFARMVKCLYCGRELVNRHEEPRRECPRCRRRMDLVTLAWVAIDRCPGCHGEYYDMGEVDPQLDLKPGERQWLMDHASIAPHDSPQGKALDCPGCRKGMQTYRIPGPEPVIVDVCPGCHGTWLDPGEAAQLRNAAKARIVPKDVLPTPPAGTPLPDVEEVEEPGMIESAFSAVQEIVDILRGKR